MTLWLTTFGFQPPLLLSFLPPFIHPPFPPPNGYLPTISITPPSTRKRKAAEAAITDNRPLTESATKAAHTRAATLAGHSRKPASTGPATTLSTESSSSASSTSQKRRDLATPATTEASMDSDDDFMSDVSSQDDFLDMQGSDDESLGEGAY